MPVRFNVRTYSINIHLILVFFVNAPILPFNKYISPARLSIVFFIGHIAFDDMQYYCIRKYNFVIKFSVLRDFAALFLSKHMMSDQFKRSQHNALPPSPPNTKKKKGWGDKLYIILCNTDGS